MSMNVNTLITVTQIFQLPLVLPRLQDYLQNRKPCYHFSMPSIGILNGSLLDLLLLRLFKSISKFAHILKS